MVPGRDHLLEPLLRNFVDNAIVVQFVHRWLAFVVAAIAIWLGVRAWLGGFRMDAACWSARSFPDSARHLTLLSGVQLDIAVSHQGMAALLLAAMVTAAHRLGERKT